MARKDGQSSTPTQEEIGRLIEDRWWKITKTTIVTAYSHARSAREAIEKATIPIPGTNESKLKDSNTKVTIEVSTEQ